MTEQIENLMYYNITAEAAKQIKDARKTPSLVLTQWLSDIMSNRPERVIMVNHPFELNGERLDFIQIWTKKHPVTLAVNQERRLILYCIRGAVTPDEVIFDRKKQSFKMRRDLGPEAIEKIETENRVSLDNHNDGLLIPRRAIGMQPLDTYDQYEINPIFQKYVNEDLVTYIWSQHAIDRAAERFGMPPTMLKSWLNTLAKEAKLTRVRRFPGRTTADGDDEYSLVYENKGVSIVLDPQKKEIVTLYPKITMDNLPSEPLMGMDTVVDEALNRELTTAFSRYQLMLADLVSKAEINGANLLSDFEVFTDTVNGLAVKVANDAEAINQLSGFRFVIRRTLLSRGEEISKSETMSAFVSDKPEATEVNDSEWLKGVLRKRDVFEEGYNQEMKNGKEFVSDDAKDVLLSTYQTSIADGQNMSVNHFVKLANDIGIVVSQTTFRKWLNTAQK